MMLLTVAQCAKYFSLSLCSPVNTQTFSKRSTVNMLACSDAPSLFCLKEKKGIFSRVCLKLCCGQYSAVGLVRQAISLPMGCQKYEGCTCIK